MIPPTRAIPQWSGGMVDALLAMAAIMSGEGDSSIPFISKKFLALLHSFCCSELVDGVSMETHKNPLSPSRFLVEDLEIVPRVQHGGEFFFSGVTMGVISNGFKC